MSPALCVAFTCLLVGYEGGGGEGAGGPLNQRAAALRIHVDEDALGQEESEGAAREGMREEGDGWGERKRAGERLTKQALQTGDNQQVATVKFHEQ